MVKVEGVVMAVSVGESALGVVMAEFRECGKGTRCRDGGTRGRMGCRESLDER